MGVGQLFLFSVNFPRTSGAMIQTIFKKDLYLLHDCRVLSFSVEWPACIGHMQLVGDLVQHCENLTKEGRFYFFLFYNQRHWSKKMAWWLKWLRHAALMKWGMGLNPVSRTSNPNSAETIMKPPHRQRGMYLLSKLQRLRRLLEVPHFTGSRAASPESVLKLLMRNTFYEP